MTTTEDIETSLRDALATADADRKSSTATVLRGPVEVRWTRGGGDLTLALRFPDGTAVACTCRASRAGYAAAGAWLPAYDVTERAVAPLAHAPTLPPAPAEPVAVEVPALPPLPDVTRPKARR